jgi:SPP1 family predicted phage head-tail adaptor
MRLPGLGKMRERVTLQQESNTADGYGGQVLAWSDVATVWAKVEPLSGREQIEADKLQGVVNTRITIRYCSDVVPGMRLVWNSINFNIRAVICEEERDRFLQLTCERGVAT